MNAPVISSGITTPHDVDPDAALAAMREHRGPVLLDLDETLYLRNSTEDFLDSAQPGLLALLLLRLVDLLRPWRWTGGEPTRDVWRVRLILLLLPWTGRRWRNRVGPLARTYGNQPLLQTLQQLQGSAIVVTAGFTPIVEPLLAALGLGSLPLVAASPARFRDRLDGKLALATSAVGIDTVRRSLVLSDSADDLPLLRACARPLRTRWPDARFRQALGHVYLPGQYLSQVKRPGERYILRGILQEDFALWVLSSIALAPHPGAHVAGLGMLLLSFWAIYERGYVDNDLVGARHERDPKLSAAFHEHRVATPRLMPWLWAVVAGATAITVLRWPELPDWTDAVAWMSLLLGTYLWFLFYNRYEKSTRVWLYPGLQAARSLALCAIVPVTPIGALALGSHVLARWIPYVAYRQGSNGWPELSFHLMRAVFLLVLALVAAMPLGIDLVSNPTAAALFAWMLYRARGEIGAAWRGARRIDRSPP